ncbi:MAG: hypothetical protein IT258_24510 [Saprospiraceae bacterium]|nr:hypothetical protein [Saprospiraceae bacterium]
MNKTLLSIYCCLFLAQLGQTQSLTGEWSGTVTQTGKTSSFLYAISLEQDGSKVLGTATSSNADGSGAAKFEVGGTFDGKLLVLQEVKQLEPENAKWCLKHIRLQYAEKQGVATLEGNWEAEGCKPGVMKLAVRQLAGLVPIYREGSPVQGSPVTQSAIRNPQSAIEGRFSGHLSQSDRDYGFYFEMDFKADGTGTSQIVSDGEGGNATHQFIWTFDQYGKEGWVYFDEREILQESVPSWRWCMKIGNLKFKEEKNRRFLSGEWKGYIEGTDFKVAANQCAPGKIYVEQPILFQNETTAKPGEPAKPDPVEIKPYETKTNREVDVERVLEVRSKTIRIRVWDNGTVDGDVLSLFLNGEQIVKNYRVTRQKHETIVKLDKPTNFIILHALNLGSISPNTVAVSVDDGFEEQVVIISSNLDKSGAIMIKEFTVK